MVAFGDAKLLICVVTCVVDRFRFVWLCFRVLSVGFRIVLVVSVFVVVCRSVVLLSCFGHVCSLYL